MELKAALVGCGAMSRPGSRRLAKSPNCRSSASPISSRSGRSPARPSSRSADAFIARDVHDAARRNPARSPVRRRRARRASSRSSAGLAAGCHVLSEKPMAETLEEARDLVARAKAAGRMHAVVQNRRYLGQRAPRSRGAIAAGAIGEVTSVHADFFLAPHFGGFREEMDHVLLLDMAIHSFDAMRCMTGLDRRRRLLPRMEPEGLLVPPGLLGGGGLRSRERRRLHLSRQLVRRRARHRVGMRVADHRDQGDAGLGRREEIRIEVGGGARKGLFDDVEAVEPPPLAPDDRIGGHAGVLADFVAAVRAAPSRKRSAATTSASLAMALGAIASAEQRPARRNRHLKVGRTMP